MDDVDMIRIMALLRDVHQLSKMVEGGHNFGAQLTIYPNGSWQVMIGFNYIIGKSLLTLTHELGVQIGQLKTQLYHTHPGNPA
jgi:hypothetical protein